MLFRSKPKVAFEVLPLNKLVDWLPTPLEHDVERVPKLEAIVHISDVRVAECAQLLQLVNSTASEFFVGTTRLQDFHRKLVVPCVSALVYDSEAALSDDATNSVGVASARTGDEFAFGWRCKHRFS